MASMTNANAALGYKISGTTGNITIAGNAVSTGSNYLGIFSIELLPSTLPGSYEGGITQTLPFAQQETSAKLSLIGSVIPEPPTGHYDYVSDGLIDGNLLRINLQDVAPSWARGWDDIPDSLKSIPVYSANGTNGRATRYFWTEATAGYYAIAANQYDTNGKTQNLPDGASGNLTVGAFFTAPDGATSPDVRFIVSLPSAYNVGPTISVSATRTDHYYTVPIGPSDTTFEMAIEFLTPTTGQYVEIDSICARVNDASNIVKNTSYDNPPGDWELIFYDNFETFDTNKWSKGWGDQIGTPTDGTTLDWNDNSVEASAEALHLKMVYVTASARWEAGAVNTRGNFDFKYGLVRIRAKHTGGGWSALWLMPPDNAYGYWPRSGEIDIMERVTNNSDGTGGNLLYSTLIFDTAGVGNSSQVNYSIEESNEFLDFHYYELLWEQLASGKVVFRWYFDGACYAQQSSDIDWDSSSFTSSQTAPFDQNFDLIMNIVPIDWFSGATNIADTGDELIIDSVEVWQRGFVTSSAEDVVTTPASLIPTVTQSLVANAELTAVGTITQVLPGINQEQRSLSDPGFTYIDSEGVGGVYTSIDESTHKEHSVGRRYVITDRRRRDH